MKNLYVSKLFPLDLQHFADEGDGGDADQNVSGQNDNDDSGKGNGSDDNKKQEKTFTQDQVSAMMAKEKNEGKRAVLKSLGFGNEDEAKKAIGLYNALLQSQKTEEEKNAEELEKAKKETDEYRLRAEIAESKAVCLENGVDKDCIDDVLAIAKTKVTENSNLEKVLSDMKKDKKYASFFGSKSKDGTGNDPGHSGNSRTSAGDYGKSLAGRTPNPNADKKSNFF